MDHDAASVHISNLTKSLEQATKELERARILKLGLNMSVDSSLKPLPQSAATSPQSQAAPRPRAASAARARPSPDSAWPHKTGADQGGAPASHFAGIQPVQSSGFHQASTSETAAKKHQHLQQPRVQQHLFSHTEQLQRPMPLHSSLLRSLPQQGPSQGPRSAAGSVAGSAAPSLAATLGRIHRQLAETSLPLKGGDAKDAKAWMMHNPKHSILQTQAKLNKLARLDRSNSKGQTQMLMQPQQQKQSTLMQPEQLMHEPVPAGGVACVRQRRPQPQQQPAGISSGMQGENLSIKGGQGSRSLAGVGMDSHTQLHKPWPNQQHPTNINRAPPLPHTIPQGGATRLAGPGAFQLQLPAQDQALASRNIQTTTRHLQTLQSNGNQGPAGLIRTASGQRAQLGRRLPDGPSNQQGPGQVWMPPTESILRQLPVMPKPWGYTAVPSEAESHADWWKSGGMNNSALGSVRSYPRTAVTDRDSVTPSELAAWEARMSSLEETIRDEKNRRRKFEEELRQLEALALSRGAISTGGIAVAKGPTAGKQQQLGQVRGA